MATREEKIAFLKQKMALQDSAPKTRAEKIAFIQSKMNEKASVEKEDLLSRLGDSALEAVGEVGSFIDKYTGAPIRAGIAEAQEGKNPLPAIADQFGEDPSLAPTGKQIAQKAGLPDTSLSEVVPSMFSETGEGALTFKKGGPADITASGAAGFGLDIAADPTNIVPGVAIAKGTKLAGQGARAAGRAAKSASIPVIDKAADILKAVTVKTGSTLTGLPEKNISTYINKTDEVNELISKHGGDMSLAADELREGLQKSIQTKISSLNADVKKGLTSATPGSFASNEAVIKALEHVKEGINPNLYPGSVSEIDDLVTKIKTLSPELSAEAANEAKRFLQDQAKGSYIKGGQLFTTSKDASKAAKAGAREARKIEMQLAPGTVAPNKELTRLHRYQENANKNLIAPGKTESALMAAGSGANARNAKNLRDIGEMTGFDALGEAEKLAAARAFAEPGYLPVDATGKSFSRMALGAMLGSFFGGPFGSAAGIAATSPAVLKQAIRTSKGLGGVVKFLAGGATNVSDEVIERAIKVAGTERGQQMIRALEKASKQENIQSTNKVAEKEKEPSTRPLRGQEKWANDGFEKLRKHSSGFSLNKDALLKSKKGKRLLIAASDLKPGTKAFNKIADQIQKEFGGSN